MYYFFHFQITQTVVSIFVKYGDSKIQELHLHLNLRRIVCIVGHLLLPLCLRTFCDYRIWINEVDLCDKVWGKRYAKQAYLKKIRNKLKCGRAMRQQKVIRLFIHGSSTPVMDVENNLFSVIQKESRSLLKRKKTKSLKCPLGIEVNTSSVIDSKELPGHSLNAWVIQRVLMHKGKQLEPNKRDLENTEAPKSHSY